MQQLHVNEPIQNNILIVDDSDTNREYLNYILQSEQYQVTQARDGIEGLKLAKEIMPQLIITDILMPSMDGYEMIRILKADEILSDIKVIFYTAQFPEQEALELAKMFGTVHYLNKPAEKKDILDMVKDALKEAPQHHLTKIELEEISKQHLALLNNKLYQKVSHLEKLNQELEERIAERTQELNVLNKKLHEEAIRDPLTGVFNRRYLDETLIREISRSERREEVFAVIMLDIDHFKNINDQFGHQSGDAVLLAISNKLKHFTRSADFVCRYGGEEFLLVLFDIDEAEAFKRSDSIREDIENMKIQISEAIIHATVSLGIAMFPKHGKDIDVLIEAADEALYTAKNSGRNRTTLYEASLKGKSHDNSGKS